MSERDCRCGRPTRDAAYVCDDCGHSLSVALGDIPWLEQELETTVSRQRGVDYRTKGGTGSSERPLPLDWTPTEARAHLRAILVSWIRFSREEKVRNASPHAGLPVDSLTAMSRWLMWRVDGLTLLDIGPEAVDEITGAVAHCRRLVDRPADRQYLGDCAECGEGRMYARPGGALARCNNCGSHVDAEQIRARLLGELEDRLCTAAEIARLSTYLGLKADRERVRKHVEYLARSGRITKQPALSESACYRFGDVYRVLVQSDYGKAKVTA